MEAVMKTETVDAPLPPGPTGRRRIEVATTSLQDPLRIIPGLIDTHGDVARIHFLWVDYYIVNHPDGVHRVLVENHKNYVKSRNYVGLKALLGRGLLTSEGELWKRQRKLSQPAFHRERLASFADTMAVTTEQMLDRWQTEGERFDLHREMMRLTLRIVGLTLFGADLDGDSKEVGEAMTTCLTWANQHAESLIRVPRWIPTPANVRFKRAKETLTRVIHRIIGERRSAGVLGEDLLGMLMSATDEATGEQMSDDQLMDEMMTLVLAGHETTANALSFTMYLLSTHPQIARDLEGKLDGILGGRRPTLADLPKLDAVRMVAEEAMRLYPPAWVVEREALADDVVLGHKIPKGATVGMFPYTLHRHRDFWPNPEGFDPTRFEKAQTEARPKHIYMPFGGGPRFCIGNAFAMMELQILLTMILQRYRLEVEPGFRLELDPSITLRPAAGLPMRRRART